MKRHTLIAALLLLAILGAARPAATTTQHADDRFLDSGGTRLRYRLIGDGTPVVLLHGFTASIESNWSFVLASMPSRFQLIALDIRGHGKSDKPHEPDSYGIHLVEDVGRLLDHLGIHSAHIAGYSMGARIALKFAASYPARVRSLVVGGAAAPPDQDVWEERLSRRAAALETSDSVVEALVPNPSPQVPAEFLRELAGNDRLALAALSRRLSDVFVTRDEIARIDKPLLALIGENDGGMSEIKALKAAAPQTEIVVIKGRGHLDAFTTPEFVASMERFLNQF